MLREVNCLTQGLIIIVGLEPQSPYQGPYDFSVLPHQLHIVLSHVKRQ